MIDNHDKGIETLVNVCNKIRELEIPLRRQETIDGMLDEITVILREWHSWRVNRREGGQYCEALNLISGRFQELKSDYAKGNNQEVDWHLTFIRKTCELGCDPRVKPVGFT